ncbi:MAG: hypothetical protein ACYSU4_15300, partial [Planctomycetota bacterium]
FPIDKMLIPYKKYCRNPLTNNKLYDANYASELELTGARLDVQRNQIQMESTLEELKLHKLYNFPKQTKPFLSDYYEAKRELERTFPQN